MLGLALAGLFIVLNGFFVAAEFALVKLRATRATQSASKRSEAPSAVNDAVSKLDRYLGVTQLGITLASLGLGWVGEPALASLANTLALALLGRPVDASLHGVVAGVSFALLTMAHVLFGELVPKLVAIQRSREAAVIAAPVLRGFYYVMLPALYVLDISSKAILKLIGLSFDTHSEASLSEDEILGIIAAHMSIGPKGVEKRELFDRLVRFSQRTARSAMVPRVDVAYLSILANGREALAYLRQQQYSRVLLAKGSVIDEVAGYLYAKDLAFDPRAVELPSLEKLARPALFVPESQGLVDVLRTMQREHTPFAVVVDEYGGTSGIITMEDLLEEIVGEIRDELDVERARIEQRAETEWDVDAQVALDELASAGLVVDDSERDMSLGALVVDRLGRLPRIGDRVEISEGVTAEVTALVRRRVQRVRVTAVLGPAAAASEA